MEDLGILFDISENDRAGMYIYSIFYAISLHKIQLKNENLLVQSTAIW